MPATQRRGGRGRASRLDRRLCRSGDEAGLPAPLVGPILRPDDQWARFQHFAWRDPAAAARQIAAPGSAAPRGAAEARLALQRDAPERRALVAALPAALRDEPGMVLDRRPLAAPRRPHRRCAGAVAARRRGRAARRAGRPARRRSGPSAISWRARLLRDGDAAGAYALADQHRPDRAGAGAGRRVPGRLHRAAPAERPGRRDARISAARPNCRKAAITQGRAHYWLGRAAGGRRAGPARRNTSAPPPGPTTFYGQLAALALGDDAAATRAPHHRAARPRVSRAIRCWPSPTARWCAPPRCWSPGAIRSRARAFLLRMDELAPDPADRSADRTASRCALGLPDTAVFVARRMGRDGLVLPEAGWPIAAEPPDGPVDPAVALGADPPGEQLRHRRGQPVRRARADAAHAVHRRRRWRSRSARADLAGRR